MSTEPSTPVCTNYWPVLEPSGPPPAISSCKEEKYQKQANAIEEAVLGPMPIAAFLDFLPQKFTTRMPAATGAFDDIDFTSDDAPGQLKKAISDYARCPGFKTSFNRVEEPEISFVEAGVELERDEPWNSHSSLFIQVRTDDHGDFFRDPPADATGEDRQTHCFVLTNEHAKATCRTAVRASWGLHVSWASSILMFHYRRFTFSISLYRTTMRLLRWDIAGVVVSEAFDVLEHPEILCEFLWRYAHASSVERGLDPTVERATAHEEYLFRTHIRAYVKTQLTRGKGEEREPDEADVDDAVDQHYEEGAGRIAAMSIVKQDGSVSRCIVSCPVAVDHPLKKCCMRGYWGVLDGRVVFVKDTWRDPELEEELEGSVLQRLHDAGVQNIPEVVTHGTVPEHLPPSKLTRSKRKEDYMAMPAQSTKTSEYVLADWICVGDRYVSSYQLVHYRLVLGTVGYPLDMLRGTKELLHVTRDILIAMKDAQQKGNTLHRDISLGNVILVNEGDDVRHGYLIDWELSSWVDSSGKSLDMPAVGTEAYMSERILRDRNQPQTIEDDMESLMYVVLDCGARWLPHTIQDLERSNSAIFCNTRRLGEGEYPMPQGEAKYLNKQDRQYFDPKDFTPPFSNWMKTVMDYNAPPADTSDFERRNFEAMWRGPQPLLDFWSDFIESVHLPEDDRRDASCEHDSSFPGKPAIRSFSHKAGKHPPKRKAPQPRASDTRPAKRARKC